MLIQTKKSPHRKRWIQLPYLKTLVETRLGSGVERPKTKPKLYKNTYSEFLRLKSIEYHFDRVFYTSLLTKGLRKNLTNA